MKRKMEKNNNNVIIHYMKIVLVADWLTNTGGGEKVVEEIAKTFSLTEVYTTVYNKDKLTPFLQSLEIHGCLQKNKEKITDHKKYFPFMPHALRKMRLPQCDVVISSSSSVGKMVKIPKGAIHIVYCHTPMRYAWVMEKEYLKTLSFWKRPLAKILLTYMRRVDLKSNKTVDYFIANSNYTGQRIKKYYKRDFTTIYPCVDVDKFTVYPHNDNYYIVISRLVSYKRIDLAIKACNELNRNLIVIGDGPELENLQKIAGSTITFTGPLFDDKLVTYLANSKAFLFPGEEDFGITPVESMASGKPVIAFGKGGALETVTNETGVFFYEQTVDSLKNAIIKFEGMSFDSSLLRKQAEKFANKVFREKIMEFVNNKTKQL